MSTPIEPNNGPDQGAAATGQDPGTQPSSSTPVAPQAGTEGGGRAPQFEGEFDPAKAARLAENLRNEVDAEKAKRIALETQFSDFMGKFTNLFGGNDSTTEQPTPEQLTAAAAQSQASARESQVQLAVFRTAAKHGGDPDALLDSASFAKAISALDPAASTFAANVEKAIKTAVENNPRLKSNTAPALPSAGGVDMSGGSTGKRQLTAAEVAHLSKSNPAALAKAREDGLLRDYLNS